MTYLNGIRAIELLHMVARAGPVLKNDQLELRHEDKMDLESKETRGRYEGCCLYFDLFGNNDHHHHTLCEFQKVLPGSG